MEPSLLILDEPTSGLDSSSSQLLLRALRRETIEGVNVSMMFDDLVLLAKGGLTVYHGSVRKVKEYFSELGINVLDRVNPPNYFIGVLEGMVKLSANSGVNYKQLPVPVRWMFHKGNDMNGNDGATEHSFAGEIWQDVRSKVEVHRDIIRHNFLKIKDLSNRMTLGILM
ncbi:ABC transporter G family member 24 [Tanacetum coccineum]